VPPPPRVEVVKSKCSNAHAVVLKNTALRCKGHFILFSPLIFYSCEKRVLRNKYIIYEHLYSHVVHNIHNIIKVGTADGKTSSNGMQIYFTDFKLAITVNVVWPTTDCIVLLLFH
jgi:hypothetical protein